MADSNVVFVVGAGVIGLTSAVNLAEGGYQVTVLADEVPGRTSLAAGASWGPYHVEPYDKVSIWGQQTLQVLTELADMPNTGVRLVPGLEASRADAAMPEWARQLPGFMESRIDQLPGGFLVGWHYIVPVLDMPTYLAYLRARLQQVGGHIEHRRVDDLAELSGNVAAIINCAGLGARKLANDDSLYPIRGQFVVVSNPGIGTFFSEDTGSSPDLTHFLPQGDTLLLGGVAVAGDWNREPDPATAEAIIARCADIEPLLRDADVIEHRAGLRPTRPQIRLEAGSVHGTRLIHNYGHGGAGVSLSWGCAAEVRDLVAYKH
ncbi:MAG: D-amino-acid oxidase [Kribbellaceae bacterium]|jgi:D-amino-acid oxidase|nr:D-amino-acid oxidase [Kribbellaceae bacterium]